MNAKMNFGALEILKEAAHVLANPAIQEWKQRGGKVVGTINNYIPEELITAAGLLPYRLRATGSTGTELADSRLTQINCSFVRHCLNLGLQGELAFLDGIVGFNSCDNSRRFYDNYVAAVNIPFHHFMVFPKKRGEEPKKLYYKELLQLKQSLEEHFSVVITDEKLQSAIKLHNETRRLQRQLYELKRRKNPPLSGAETMAIMVAGTSIPKGQYNQLLEELLENIGSYEGQNDYRARLMIVGGDLDNSEFIDVIEKQGGLIVADSLEFGSRSMWIDVAEDGDPLSALASYYIEEKSACPRIIGTTSERYAFIMKMVKDFDVAGIVSVRLPLCDYWAFDQDEMTKFFRKKQIPYLKLENEYVLSNVGQLKTRVQAFLETVEGCM